MPTPQEAAPSGPCWLALGGQPCCPHRGRPRPHPVPRPSPGLKARPAPRPPCDRPLSGAPGPRWCPDCPAPREAVKTPVQRPEADLRGGARAPSHRPSACVAVCPPHGLHGAATPTGKDRAGRGRDPGGSRPCPANTRGGPKTGRQGGWGRAGVPVPPGPGAGSRLRGDPRGLGGGPRLRARPSLRPPSTGFLCSRPPCRPRTDRDPSPARPRRPPRWAPVHCQAPHRASPGGQPAPPPPGHEEVGAWPGLQLGCGLWPREGSAPGLRLRRRPPGGVLCPGPRPAVAHLRLGRLGSLLCFRMRRSRPTEVRQSAPPV